MPPYADNARTHTALIPVPCCACPALSAPTARSTRAYCTNSHRPMPLPYFMLTVHLAEGVHVLTAKGTTTECFKVGH